ncbi:MAG: ATP-binding protein [Spirulinaceae cyanobacterium RM2_2_10]|nr:ATP-binding protein [Spirulinaceae cyanobacterium SM2_1_0]NJO19630.1 ATP-binding protein [Spirulinaceae cyanobacterium RM2_2_10]
MSEELISDIYNAFKPYEALPADSPVYVRCSEVRGQENIFNEVGREIPRSNQSTCQLYTGHRGVGKSTELLRLKKYLEENGCLVVYFGATDSDIDEQDAQHTDILLACTRHILEDLKELANPRPLLQWLGNRLQELQKVLEQEVQINDPQVDVQIGAFAKLTANLQLVPGARQRIRAEVEAHTKTLTQALNDFIVEAKQHLPAGKTKLVVIADNLDRIVPVQRENGRNNHDEIFIDRCLQLRALQCHVIYTVPLSLVYSDRATEIRDNYKSPQILPMIMVQTRQNQIYPLGIERLSQIIQRRVDQVQPDLALDGDVFDMAATRLRLCEMSGGHVRELMLLLQVAIEWTDALPITGKAVRRAITEARENTYRNAVDDSEWIKLAEVAVSKQVPNEAGYRDLLFRRCLLEYREFVSEDEIVRWHDVHPLIRDLAAFQTALTQVQTS